MIKIHSMKLSEKCIYFSKKYVYLGYKLGTFCLSLYPLHLNRKDTTNFKMTV